MIQALLTRRCDALVMDDYIFYYHKQGVKGIKELDKPLIVANVGVCFGKGVNVELREQFNVGARPHNGERGAGRYPHIGQAGYDYGYRYTRDAFCARC